MEKYGRLTPIEIVGSNKDKRKVWKCLCDCGKEVNVVGKDFRSGNTKSCGCLFKEVAKSNEIDYTGKRYGRLFLKERRSKPQHGSSYICLCDCGKEIEVILGSLLTGNTKSCGCLFKETLIKGNKDRKLNMKRFRSSNRRFLINHWKTGEELVCVGAYEANIVDYLNLKQIDFDWQILFNISDGRAYLCDLFLKESNVYVEIKGWWREYAKAKFEMFKTENPFLKVEVWDKSKLKELGLKDTRASEHIKDH